MLFIYSFQNLSDLTSVNCRQKSGVYKQASVWCFIAKNENKRRCEVQSRFVFKVSRFFSLVAENNSHLKGEFHEEQIV